MTFSLLFNLSGPIQWHNENFDLMLPQGPFYTDDQNPTSQIHSPSDTPLCCSTQAHLTFQKILILNWCLSRVVTGHKTPLSESEKDATIHSLASKPNLTCSPQWEQKTCLINQLNNHPWQPCTFPRNISGALLLVNPTTNNNKIAINIC